MKKGVIIAAIALLLGMASCTKQEQGVLPKTEEKTLTLQLIPDEPMVVTTRGTLNENKIYNAVVLIFSPNDAEFTMKTAYLGGGTNSLTIPNVSTGNGAGYVLYVAANVGMSTGTTNAYSGYFNFVGLESDVMSHLRLVNSNLDFRTPVSGTEDALMMSGKVVLTGSESGTLTVSLKRQVAKVKYNITFNEANSDLNGFHIRNVRFGNVPGATYFWERIGQDAPLTADQFLVSDFFYPAADRRSATGEVFLPENRRGTGGDKSSTTVNGAPTLATYLEFTVESAAGKTFYYRVYLGKDNAMNYDIVRNCIYDVSILVNGTNGLDDITSDIRIIKPGDDWYETDGLLLHYDGIYNNGMNEPQVTNQTLKKVNDPYLMRFNANKFNYSPSYQRVETDYTSETAGAINRWRNIAPATINKYSMPLYGFPYNDLSGWGPDCLIFSDAVPTYLVSSTTGTGTQASGRGSQCSMAYEDDLLRPQEFTIETVFMAEPGKNTASGGCDLYGFLLHPTDPTGRYVISGVEAYPTGMGFIAGGKWNGQNYAISNMAGYKRRVVIQFDGVNMTAWYGEKIVYREMKFKAGPLPWPTAPLGSTGTGEFPSMLTFGKFYCNDFALNFSGRIYAFRFYDRVLSEEELHHNYLLDEARFGIPKN